MSANSTSVLASNASLGIGTPVTVGLGHRPFRLGSVTRTRCYDAARSGLTARRLLSLRRRIETQRSGDDSLRDLGEPTVIAEGVGPQPHQGFPDADAELDGDHPGGLVHDVLEVGALLQLGGKLAGRRVRLQEDDRMRGDVGHDERVGMLLVGQRRRSLASTD